jgi:polyisoprenyl-phosphate glycosyltransferase
MLHNHRIRDFAADPPLPALSRTRSQDPLLSIVVPIYNEAESISIFLEALQEVFKALDARKECIFVNDGSIDSSFEVLLRVSASCNFVKVVNLSRNFGKEAAITAGLDLAAGDAVIVMDVDLQDPPDVIPEFVARWREGYDIVCGFRRDRKADGRIKGSTARMFYALFNRFSDTTIPPNVGDFRLLDRRAVEAVKCLPERTRFMKGLFAWVGFPSVCVSYERPQRRVGRSKWSYWKLWNFALDGIVSFSSVPIKVWSYIGGVFALIALFYALFIVLRVLIMGLDVPGYASLVTVLLFSTGLQLVSLGMIGEYISRLFVEAKRRPIYLLEGVYLGGVPVALRPGLTIGSPVREDARTS